MARKSKSSKNTDKTESSSESETPEIADLEEVEFAESITEGDPVVIEAEAVDVTQAEDLSPETEMPENEAEDNPADIISDEDARPEDAADTNIEADMPAVEPAIIAAPTKSSPIPLVFGGLLAGGLGYLAATMFPPPAPFVDTSALTESVAENGERLEALSTELAALAGAEDASAALSGIEGAITGLGDRLDVIDTDISSVRDQISGVRNEIAATAGSFEETSNALSDRLTVLETAGASDNPEAETTQDELAAFRAELQRMTSEAEAEVAASLARASEIENAAAETTAAAAEAAAEAERKVVEAEAAAAREAAIVDLKKALENGLGYAEVLPTIGDVPEALSAHAEDGVASLLSLQQEFPGAARSALASVETIPQDASTGERLTSFLKQRTGARSLTPKEGNSADAVLSRAESMIKQGDLGGAVTELQALSDAPKAAMQGWLDQANTRQAALEAADQLSTTN